MKQLDDLARLPTPSEICKLDNSSYKDNIIKSLRSFACSDRLASRREYCLARDYLLTYTILDNATRSGCIANMTMKEFKNAEYQSDGSYIVNVIKHKTAATAGPAMLSIRSDLMQH